MLPPHTENGEYQKILGEPLRVINEYNPKETLKLYARKRITGRSWLESDSFQFRIEAITPDAPMPDASVVTVTGKDVDRTDIGLKAFGDITFELKHKDTDYIYKITEVQRSTGGFTLDTNAYYLKIKFKENANEGKLVKETELYYLDEACERPLGQETSITVDGITYPVFINPYDTIGDPTLSVTKKVDGRVWENETFTFRITKDESHHSEDIPMPDPAEITIDKTMQTKAFGPIVYTKEDLKQIGANNLKYDDFYYKLFEVAPAGAVDVGNGVYRLNGINYDTNPHSVYIRAEDNGEGEILSHVYIDGVMQEQIDAGSLTVTNPYGYDPLEDPLIIYKMTEGKPEDLVMDFPFTIEGVSNTAGYTVEEMPLPEKTTAVAHVVTNNAFYQANFGKFNITRNGTYVYRIYEVVQPGWIGRFERSGWQKAADRTGPNGEEVYYHDLTITVALDDTLGKLVITHIDHIDLINAYDPVGPVPIETLDPIEDVFPFVKMTTDMPEGESITFRYRLVDKGNTAGLEHNPMPLSDEEVETFEESYYHEVDEATSGEATADEADKKEFLGEVTVYQNGVEYPIDFGTIFFTKPGEYTYAIEELDLPLKWKALPSRIQQFTIKITGDKNGNLRAIYPKILFNNLYDPDKQIIKHTDQEFVFKKIWTGYPGDPPAFSWTLYRDGEVADPQHQFIIDEDGNYHAYDMRYGDYYLIENVPQDFQAVYHNIGQYADITDRLYSGGVLENVYLPDTGDRDNPVKWMMLFGGSVLAIALLVIVTKRKQKTGKK